MPRSGRSLGVLRRAAFIAASAFFGLGAAVHAQAGTASITAAPPSGFEALERPQTTLVDVYVGGVRVASTLARYTSGGITFLKPEEVLAATPHLKAVGPVAAALREKLPANVGQICDGDAPTTCGRLSPDVVGVIFDEARFRADLFINPAFVDIADPLSSQYLPTPKAQVSAVSITAGVLSGDADGHVAYGMQNRTVVSVGALRFTSDVSQTSGDGFRADSLSAAVERGSLRYEAGLLRAPSLDFFGQGRIIGASVGTQLDTLVNRDLVAAAPVLVYLQQRSRVDVYRGARLLTSGTYDAGNQLIDTSGMPDGSYEIVLRIREADGATREQRRFFSRTRSLPPLGRPQFQLTVGSLLAEDDLDGRGAEAFAQLRYARRLAVAYALDAAVSLAGSDPAAALGFSWASSALQLRLEGMAGREALGVAVDAAVNLRDHAVLTFDVRRAWSRGVAVAPASADPVIDPTGAASSRFGFAGDGMQVSASMATTVRGAQIAFSGSYTRFRDARAAYAGGLSIDAPLPIGRSQGVHIYASAAETDRGAQTYVGLRFRFGRGRAAAFGDVGYARAPGGEGAPSGPVANLAATDQWTTPAGQVTGTTGYVHAADHDAVSAVAELRGPAGDVGMTVEHDVRGDPGTRFSGNFLFGAAFAGGRPSLGSAETGDSGVVVTVAGPKDAAFQVLVNDAPAGRVAAGGRLALFLPAYRVYRVRLAPLEGAPVTFDTGERQVSLFPGNVVPLAWSAEPEIEVFGRAVDERGAPVANAVIAGSKAAASTDSNGYFQASVGAADDLVLRTAAGGSCRLRLQALTVGKAYIAVGARTCQTVSDPVTIAGR